MGPTTIFFRNHGKHSVVIGLKTETGRETPLRLVSLNWLEPTLGGAMPR